MENANIVIREATADDAEEIISYLNIELEVIADNKAAIALYHKMGFFDVGVIKNYWFANNAYSDAIVMQKCLDE